MKQKNVIPDSSYWQRYDLFYEKLFDNKYFKNILMLSQDDGQSAHWLNERFPKAKIVSVSSKPIKKKSTSNKLITHIHGELENVQFLEEIFNIRYDLIIDNSVKLPSVQPMLFKYACHYINRGGMFISEGLQTNFRSHPVYKYDVVRFERNEDEIDSLLHLALMFRAILRGDIVGSGNITKSFLNFSGINFSIDELIFLQEKISKVFLHRRIDLPLLCWNCQSREFSLKSLKCSCGVDLFYDEADSMAGAFLF